MKRFHVRVSVEDLAAAVRFYSTLFDATPSVQRPDYAKWLESLPVFGDDARAEAQRSACCIPLAGGAGENRSACCVPSGEAVGAACCLE